MRPDRSGEGRAGAGREPERPLEPDNIRAFARVFTDAVTDEDPQDVPVLLCRACVRLLDVSGASVSLSDGATPAVLWWSSDEVAGQLAEAQYTLGEGPCTTALAQVAPVLAEDLRRAPDASRWPLFAQRAAEFGVRAVFSFPFGGGVQASGTLDLYRRESGPLSAQDQALVLPACKALTYALMRIHTDADDPGTAGPGTGRAGADDRHAWMDGAQEGHEEVNQATGMVIVQLRVDPQHALARLRGYAFAHGLTLTEVAREVVCGRLVFDE
ncbi:GAF domain-containing protein [Actinacidiphila yanglinensis]|uniref:GAF domain-containing protein n=1 Tax=Actinacidiphila yanglinensis TaxID=310779 RepID=A0A1H6DPG8_9ACTN|nr:GAF and ANTAR domain-containing protein [Actinacidiphila yanglinensis]SEG87257.1 GAF domain-containing protein [Actinacidiphila yanglinensis]